MLKRSNLVVGSVLVGSLVGVGAIGGVAALRRKRQKGRSAAVGGGSTLLAPEGSVAGDAGTLGADWTGFAQAVGRRGGKTAQLREVAMAAAGNGSRVGVVGPGGYAELDGWDDVVAMVGSGLDGNPHVEPFGQPQFRQPEFRQPDVVSRRPGWMRSVRVSGLPPVVEPHPVGAVVPVLEVVRDASGRPQRSNYRMKRARQWMVDRAKEDERWARLMGGKVTGGPSDARAVISPSTLSVNEADRHDELSQLGQVEMEIFTDGRPSGEHPSISRGRRFVMWFRMRVLGEER